MSGWLDRLRSLGRSRWSRRAAARGYSMIEVLMGMAILSVGASGVIALQKVTVLGVTTGRNINAATAIAMAHVEAVRTDAVRWNNRTDYSDAALINAILAGTDTDPTDNEWVVPTTGHGFTDDPGLGMSDVTGATAGTAADRPPIAYCTQLRLTPLEYELDPSAPADRPASDAILMRLEVRTFWAKSGRAVTDECDPTVTEDVSNMLAGGSESFASGPARTADDYGWVFFATAIRRNDIVVED